MEKNRSCPCTYITPCSSQCSCANPIMSGGCSRCCMYGSESQRKSSAERLVLIEKLAHDSINGNSSHLSLLVQKPIFKGTDKFTQSSSL